MCVVKLWDGDISNELSQNYIAEFFLLLSFLDPASYTMELVKPRGRSEKCRGHLKGLCPSQLLTPVLRERLCHG